ncbi:ParB/RepB/Spo0J family partition protein [Rhizobium sp. NPDC090275]|uniref:ParB/RepB/Spo0J family partition protein n=1 Tax=Rhizobium sp. NPDC090275 TaxID=3364498 RepID=UPI00383AD268
MHLMKVDPRALRDNPDNTRQTKSTPQADALLLATIKAVGIIQPPVIFSAKDGGNDYIIEAGHRRTRLAIAAGLEEIDVIVVEAANDNGAMRSMVENIAREPLNAVDQWRGIERLVALDWTEEAIAIALTLSVRRVKQLRLLANVFPAMLNAMAKGSMPNEQQLRTIASASIDDQREVWKANKPSKADPQVDWWRVAQALSKTRMWARDASFDDELARAYGIEWIEELFEPAGVDARYTTNVEAYLGAQQEWMSNNLPKKGAIVEVNNWGQPQLPAKAERVYGKAGKGDHTAMYLDRDGKVQNVHFRMPEAKKGKDGSGTASTDDAVVMPKTRPDVTRKGIEMIGDYRTEALHEALARAPIEDDTLTALLVLTFGALNVSVTSPTGASHYSSRKLGRHAASLFDVHGKLVADRETLQQAIRGLLIDVLSCRENATNSGLVARLAGDAIGADSFLPNMGTDEFLSCLSRPALEGSCKDTPVLPRQKVKDTRAALVEHFKEERFVHASALFEPDAVALSEWLAKNAVVEDDDHDDVVPEAEETAADGELAEGTVEQPAESDADGFREAAE